MMRMVVLLGVFWVGLSTASGASSVSPWTPLFQGIDHAVGTNDAAIAGNLSVQAIRIDLHDPEVELVVTPPITNNYVPNQRETLMRTPREFLIEHGLQIAVNAGGTFSPNSYDVVSGTAGEVQGAVVSQGLLVSSQTRSNESMSAVMFGPGNEATFHFVNWPAASTEGVFNAMAGMYPLVSNGQNFAYFYYTNAMSDGIHHPQPRTALGLSQDNRYLYLMTIDGRQEFSEGAVDFETAEFLLLLGAWNGMNMDGGGSTCMVKMDDFGDAEDLNLNSFQWAVGRPGSQRVIGCNFGVRSATALSSIKDLVVTPGTTTAIILWRTEEPTTTKVEYGLTKTLGNSTSLDSRLVNTHVATLTDLVPGSNYYFRVVSTTASAEYTRGGHLQTTNDLHRTLLFDVTQSWKYTGDNLDGVDWTASRYDDSAWLGPGPGLLYIEDNAAVSPRNTALPQPVRQTYYLRTQFEVAGSLTGASLLFSNYVDDGAVFYLNGEEVYRLRLPDSPTVILNSTPATSAPCNGDAACAEFFTISATKLVPGTNVLAAELHNRSGGTGDVVFGAGLLLDRPSVAQPVLNILMSDNSATLYWNGSGFTLQRTTPLSDNEATWENVSTISPVVVANTGTTFYRLRK